MDAIIYHARGGTAGFDYPRTRVSMDQQPRREPGGAGRPPPVDPDRTMLQDRLRALSRATLAGMLRGIEKESLRVRPDGVLALTPHPAALGSALAHPHITPDFSE